MIWGKRNENRPQQRDLRRDGPTFEVLSTRTFSDASCESCQLGRLLSFNWRRAGKRVGANAKDNLPAQSFFQLEQTLRIGYIYTCTNCRSPWHLDSAEEVMSAVPVERLPLIVEWNRAPIVLSGEVAQKLDLIGATPPHRYGSGRQYKQTPCSATTNAGDRIDLAIVSIQAHAPFEPHRNYRLGSEIVRVDDSPFALPLDVRIATSQAEEITMGFAPTIIEMLDGKLFTLNWVNHFLVKDGYCAADANVLGRGASPIPEIVKAPKEIVYFVADR